ncbi:MAG: hypothetical protein KDB18_03540 [Salinibacterium sp.]|nr:hypothetical protein [Salinibacterium sp.]
MPDFEWQGTWVTIWGFDTQPEDTCAGTFQYLDDYSGLLAAEYGITEPLGVYRWYSDAEFLDDDPCRRASNGCAGLNGVFARVMPLEHELVHAANIMTTVCPSLLSEGLAEYYGTNSKTPTSRDLSSLLGDPGVRPFPASDYPIAGAFAAYLVENYGLDQVLEVCERAGISPSAAEFSDAVSVALNVSLDTLASKFESFDCSYQQYRSKLSECSQSPSLVIGVEDIKSTFNLDCSDELTIGPRDDEIWTLATAEATHSGTYLVALKDESGTVVEDIVGFEIIQCDTKCADYPRVHSFKPGMGPVIAPVELDAGTHAIRIWGEPETSALLTLEISLL